jgi:hypothetical protein
MVLKQKYFSNNLLLWLTLAIAVMLFNGSCKKTHSGDVVLAKIGDNKLYMSDLKGLFKKGLTAPDSVAIAKGYIDAWVRKQLLIEKAELNLTDDQKDVDKEIEEYRSSLLIYRYEQSLIEQKLDTIVKDNEIDQYYQQNQNNFVLSDAMVKAILIKLPHNAPNMEKIRAWYKSDKTQDITALEGYCYQFAKTYDYFNDDWIYFGQLMQYVPMLVTEKNDFLRNNSCFETEDSAFHYFIRIKDYKPIGSTAPLKLVKNDIKNIILNKRKMSFIKDLETNIYNDGLKKGSFKIYGSQ